MQDETNEEVGTRSLNFKCRIPALLLPARLRNTTPDARSVLRQSCLLVLAHLDGDLHVGMLPSLLLLYECTLVVLV